MAVPKLRFKDENGADYPEWKVGRLKDYGKAIGGYGFPEKYQGIIDNKIPFFKVSDMNTVGNEITMNIANNTLSTETAKEIKVKPFLKKAIVFAKVGAAVYLERKRKAEPPFLVDNNMMIYQSDSIDFDYLYHWFSNQKISRYAQIGALPSYNAGDIHSVKISVPCLEEQQKIADFLTTFDKRITAQQNIIADMEETKKGLLQKIFSQEIRFKDDNGEDYPEWEKKSWEENVIISTDMVNPKNEEYINLPHVGPGNIESFNGCLLDNILTAKEENLISGKFHFMPGAIIYGKINPQLAKYAHVNFEGLSSADAYVLTATNSLCQNFLFFLLQSKDFFRYSVMVSRRTGMPKINRDELNAFKFMCPSLQEQQKIASFLSTYDKKIEAEKKILADLQEMKKGLLQQMFV